MRDEIPFQNPGCVDAEDRSGIGEVGGHICRLLPLRSIWVRRRFAGELEMMLAMSSKSKSNGDASVWGSSSEISMVWTDVVSGVSMISMISGRRKWAMRRRFGEESVGSRAVTATEIVTRMASESTGSSMLMTSIVTSSMGICISFWEIWDEESGFSTLIASGADGTGQDGLVELLGVKAHMVNS